MPAASLASLLVSATISAFGLPLGLPPGPEDPLMARVAPPDCAFYVSWSATAAPQPGSANPLEKLLLDAEMKRSGGELDKALTSLTQTLADKGPPQLKR